MMKSIKSAIKSIKVRLFPYKEKIMQPVRILLTLNVYLKIVKLFNLPQLESVKKYHPKIRTKYLKNYLSLSLSYRSRGVALYNHYHYLSRTFSTDFMNDLMKNEIILWEKNSGAGTFFITLTYPYYELEGDLSLIFYANSKEVFTISFTIIPGHIMSILDEQVILITRSQGTIGSFHHIKETTKNLNETTPVTLLIIVVMAIADSLHLSSIVGITSREQVIAGSMGCREKDFSTYEMLWLSLGGEIINDKLYRLPTRITGKPLSEIRQKHRARTKRKREFKQEVFDRARTNMNKLTKDATVQEKKLTVYGSHEELGTIDFT